MGVCVIQSGVRLCLKFVVAVITSVPQRPPGSPRNVIRLWDKLSEDISQCLYPACLGI